MKQYNWIIVAAISIMAMALVSCNKEIALQETAQKAAGTISVSVDGIMGEYVQGNETKAELVSTTRVSWKADDKVYVYDGASCLGELTVSLKDGKDYYAALAGENITAPQTGTTKLTLVYSNATISEISNGKVTVDISSQEGSTTPKDIPFVAFGTLDYTSGTPEISGQIADFSLATSLMRLNCTGLEAGAAISGATLKGMSNECVLNITKEGATIGQGNMGDVNVSFKGVSASSKGAQTLYAAVAQNESANQQGLTITQTWKCTYSFGNKARAAGKAVNAICQMVKGGIPGMFTVNAEGKKVLFSQGNLWADATDPLNPVFSFEANQNDFQAIWSSSHISHFYWSKFVEDAIKGEDDFEHEGRSDDVFFTNFTAESANPVFTVDGETGTYRMLSVNEWKYLLDSRIVNGDTGNDKSYSLNITYGRNMGLVIYPDDYNGPTLTKDTEYTEETFPIECVFLPGVGIRMGVDIIFPVSGGGTYWTSSGEEYDGNDNSDYAYGLGFDNDHVDIASGPRVFGNSVRLVTDCE